MIYKMYSIRDTKTAFMAPHLDVNHDAAKRNFKLTLATVSPESVMGFCPEDFVLYYIGDFDTDSGLVSPPTVPEPIAHGSSLEV